MNIVAIDTARMNSVTDKSCLAVATENSRNVSECHQWHIDRIAKLAEDKIKAKPYSHRMFVAEKTGEHCGYCGKTLSAEEEVTLCSYGIRWRQHGASPVCKACYDIPRSEREIQFHIIGFHGLPTVVLPCEACQRRLRLRVDPRRKRIYCSDRCYGRLSKPAAQRETIPCDICQEMFTPGRADGRYCSGKCRQKAYRQRNRL